MKKLYSFYWECEDTHPIEGLFIEEEWIVNSVIGKTLCFKNATWESNDIMGILEECDLKVLNVSEKTVIDMYKNIGTNISGYNPLHFIYK